jgi:rhomboid protease GluP
MMILDSENFKQAKITLTLIFTNIFCFIISFLFFNGGILLLFAQINLNIIENLEIWRLFTAMFLHADVMHLFSNMIALFLFGASVESNRKFTRIHYILIYFISGLLGNLFSLIILPLDSISLGASGAIFGLIGATFLVVLKEDRSLLILALLYISYFVFSSFTPGTNAWAHIFGLLGGISLGYLFGYFPYRKSKYELEY